MNRTGVRKHVGLESESILAASNPFHAIGVQVSNTGVTQEDEDGNLIIRAGSILTATASPYTDRTQGMTQATADAAAEGEKAYGVTQHTIVFYDGATTVNAQMIDFGWIDMQKMHEDAVAPDWAKEELAGRVTFMNGRQ